MLRKARSRESESISTTGLGGVFSGVRPHVPGDHVSTACSVRACWAAIRLLAGVRALVGREVIGAREYLAAHWTSVRLHTAVQAGVTRQHVRTCETTQAGLAFILTLCIRGTIAVARCNMLRQAVVHRECLATGAAREGILLLQRVRVELRLLGKVERRVLRSLWLFAVVRCIGCVEHEPARGHVMVVIPDVHGEPV